MGEEAGAVIDLICRRIMKRFDAVKESGARLDASAKLFADRLQQLPVNVPRRSGLMALVPENLDTGKAGLDEDDAGDNDGEFSELLCSSRGSHTPGNGSHSCSSIGFSRSASMTPSVLKRMQSMDSIKSDTDIDIETGRLTTYEPSDTGMNSEVLNEKGFATLMCHVPSSSQQR